MKCHSVRDSISAFLDGRLPAVEAGEVSRHLAGCRNCGVYAKDLTELRRLMRTMPQRRVPGAIESRLRVMASHQAARRVLHMTWGSLARGWLDSARLAIDNAMRPVALPFAGGLCSALVLFLILMPNLGFERKVSNDVPIALYTEASMIEPAMIEMAPFNKGSNDEIVIEVSLDEKGEITGYSIPEGVKISHDIATGITQMMLLSSFTPATLFGQPTPSKLLVSFRSRSGIVVKG
jgi:hypothetical protein